MSDNLLWMQNPELAQAMRRQKMGQQLMQQGTDTSPIQSPWQGVARLAQALVGGYEARKGREEITGYGEKSASDRDAFSQRISAALGGAPKPPAQHAMPGPAPAAMPAPAPPSGVSPELIGMATPIAQKYGVPLNVALGLVLQESGGNPGAVGDGGQSVGLGQIKDTTAMQPGYGVPPLDPAKRGDPAANLDFSLNYLTSKARHLGFGDLSNPENVDKALAAYNGGGDPNYVQNVRGRMPGDMAAPVAGPAGAPTQGAPAPMAGGMDARALHALALEAQSSRDPQIRAYAPLLMQMARQHQPDAESFRDPVTVAGPDGKPMLVQFGNRGTMRPVSGAQPEQKPGANGGPFAGNAMDGQSLNILLDKNADPNSPVYAAAFYQVYGPKTVVGLDGVATTIQPTPPPSIRPPTMAPPPGTQQGAAPVANAPPSTTTEVPGGVVTRTGQGKTATLTESQSKSNMFGLAMAEGNRVISEIGTPSSAVITAYRNLPEGIVNFALSADDQQYFNALRQFAAGVLRKETGAAFTPSEVLDVQSRFFPMPGDSPETKVQKERARRQAIEAMRSEIPGGFRGQIEPPQEAGLAGAQPPPTPGQQPGAGEQTAVNPRTGEKLILRNGRWEPMQ